MPTLRTLALAGAAALALAACASKKPPPPIADGSIPPPPAEGGATGGSLPRGTRDAGSGAGPSWRGPSTPRTAACPAPCPPPTGPC